MQTAPSLETTRRPWWAIPQLPATFRRCRVAEVTELEWRSSPCCCREPGWKLPRTFCSLWLDSGGLSKLPGNLEVLPKGVRAAVRME